MSTHFTRPAYTGINPPAAPIDFLFLNLSNLPGRPVYPYAFVQVSALARRAGLSVVRWDGLDLSLEHKLECIEHLITIHRPRAIGFTVRQADSVAADNYLSVDGVTPPKSPWFPLEETRVAIARVRELSTAKILVGGFNFTVNAEAAAAFLQPDLGILGEADELFWHWEEVLNGRTDGIANLLYCVNGQWQRNRREYYGPLDEIEYTPEIVDEIFRFHGERNLRNAHMEAVPGLGSYKDTGLSIAIEISRGCPCSCAFCCEPLVKGKTVRRRNLDVVEAEIHNLLRYGLRYFWFICSELNASKKHVMELAARLIKINQTLKHPIFWRAYFLPGVFKKDEFRLLRRSGLLIEQSGAFTTLDDENLARMQEPYRVKNALEHIHNLMELDQEPEFAAMRQPRWVLWSWLGNPFATLDSIRTTLDTFQREGLDLKYDEADSYPALRVYPILQHLPAAAKQEAITVTRFPETEKSLIHPSYYYTTEFVRHFSGIGGVHDFMQYARETFLSKSYRLTRNWCGLAQSLGLPLLEQMLQPLQGCDLAGIALPPWLAHPDLGQQDPQRWYADAQAVLQQGGSTLAALMHDPQAQPNRGNAILALLLHSAFANERQYMVPVFQRFGLAIDENGYPPVSPYRAVSTLLQFASDDAALQARVERECDALQGGWMRYYLEAINVRLRPEYEFLRADSELALAE
jgi:hypothetical protein